MSKRNNWLSKLVLSALMVTTFVPQALAAEVGQAPTISSVTATPNPYDPKNASVNFGVVTMSWSLNTSSNVKVEVYQPGDNVTPVATPMDITNRDPGADGVNWNGKHNGAYVAEGTYTYKISATNLYSAKDASNNPIPTVKTGTFVIDYADTNNSVAPDISGVTVSPNPFDPDSTSTTFTFNLDKSADVKLEILGTTYSSTTTFSAGNSKTKSWNGRDNSNNKVGDGTYTYRLTASNPGTTTPNDVATGTIVVDSNGGSSCSVNITSNYVSPSSFNPENEDTDFVVGLNSNADDLTVEVKIDGDYIKVDGTKHNVSQGTFNWDGEDEDGDVVDSGTYTYRVTATDAGCTDTATGTVHVSSSNGGNDHDDDFGDLIDNIDTDRDDFNPDDNEKVKLEFDVVKNSVKVTVDVLDEDDDVIRTLFTNKSYDDSNNNTVSWDGEDKDGDQVDDGDYTIRIRATKSGYPNEVAYRDVEVDTDGSNNNDDDFEDDYGDLIDNVDVENALFEPKEGERAKLIFDVEQDNVDITVDVIDRDEDIEKDLIDKQYDDSNNNNVYWNGKDDDNDIVKDELYLFRIKAEKSGEDDEVAYRWLEVDTDGIIIGFPNDNDGENCAGYTDVPANNPYCKAIELMKIKGIFTGYSDGTFRIGSAINRAETVKVVVLAIGLSLANNNAVHFWDVPNNAWYITYLASAVRYGVINGYPDGAFRGDRVVNRVELLKIFLEGTGITMPYCTKAPFNDTPANAETRWYIDYVCFAANNGLMYGDGAGNYNPAAPMTRGDVAMLFYNFYVRGMDSQIDLSYYTGTTYTNSPYTYVPTTSYYYY